MKKIILFAVLGLVIAGVAIGLYVMRPSAEASSPIQALPLDPQSSPTQASASQNTGSQSTSATAGSGQMVYQIAQDQSEVTFKVDEVLRGNPTTAVGKTNQVAGEIAVDFDNAAVQLGTIQVNARTLATDNNFRNRAIQNEILDTSTYELITFIPKSIDGLPKTAKLGDEVSVTITGDLTIRNVTQEATFTGKIKLVSMDRLEGSASGTVKRSDYKLVIPNVPNVANVSDDVLLEIQFVAIKK